MRTDLVRAQCGPHRQDAAAGTRALSCMHDKPVSASLQRLLPLRCLRPDTRRRDAGRSQNHWDKNGLESKGVSVVIRGQIYHTRDANAETALRCRVAPGIREASRSAPDGSHSPNRARTKGTASCRSTAWTPPRWRNRVDRRRSTAVEPELLRFKGFDRRLQQPPLVLAYNSSRNVRMSSLGSLPDRPQGLP